jgi:hypothetical protein
VQLRAEITISSISYCSSRSIVIMQSEQRTQAADFSIVAHIEAMFFVAYASESGRRKLPEQEEDSIYHAIMCEMGNNSQIRKFVCGNWTLLDSQSCPITVFQIRHR